MEIPSYPKARSLSPKYHEELLSGRVIVQEKLDGSQFSWLRDGSELVARSKNTHRDVYNPDNMFGPAINYLRQNLDDVPEGIVFRGEAFMSPNHNVLDYERAPEGYIVLFGARRIDDDSWFSSDELVSVADEIGIETARTWYEGDAEELVSALGISDDDQFDALHDAMMNEFITDEESMLGGVEPEGVVIKNHTSPMPYARFAVGKVVRDDFKERVQHESPAAQTKNTREQLLDEYASGKEARWDKVIQHATEDGELDAEPSDLAHLIPALREDLFTEAEDEVKQALWDDFKNALFKKVKAQFPEHYKQRLREGEIE